VGCEWGVQKVLTHDPKPPVLPWLLCLVLVLVLVCLFGLTKQSPFDHLMKNHIILEEHDGGT